MAALLVALVPVVQLTALGANDAVLAVAAACLNLAAALAVLVLLPPDAGFWRRAWLPPALLLGALLWALLPQLPLFDRLPPLQAAMALRPAPDLARAEAVKFLGGVALLLAAAWVGYRRGAMRIACDWLIVFGTANLVLALVLRDISPGRVWGLPTGIHALRFTGTLLNANAAAAAFAAIALIACGRMMMLAREQRDGIGRARTPFILALACVALLGLAGACLITGSRSATVLLCLALGALGLFGRNGWNGRTALVALGIAGVVIGAFALLGQVLLDRLPLFAEDAMARTTMWSHYLRVAAESPLFGQGLGAFHEINQARLGVSGETATYWYVNSAHNVVIQMAIEGGWPFVLLVGAAVMAILHASVTAERRAREPIVPALYLALLLLLGCALVDIALNVPAVASLAVLLLGLLWGRSLRASGALPQSDEAERASPASADRHSDHIAVSQPAA